MNKINFTSYRVLFDGQSSGFDASGGSIVCSEGEMTMLFQKASDGAKGLRPLMTKSSDFGRSWTQPEPFGPDILKDPENEFMGLGLFGPSEKGTIFCVGVHLVKGITGNYRESIKWRPGTAIIGRKEKGDIGFTYQYYPTGTFSGEQFAAPGIVLSDGRLLLTIWGAQNQYENWSCGVLISDDDGLTWKYSNVGNEQDLSIRNAADMPAGYNEQSLFETLEGDIVSLIRGRDKLGLVEDSPRDTWFLHSFSKDRGETWSHPVTSNIAGTGASHRGITLPDGSLLHACRIPYHRTMYSLPEPDCYGLHLARSFDKGMTWSTELLLQHDPDGRLFDNYYNAMNGQFVAVAENKWMYIFGQFDKSNNIHRMLTSEFEIR